MLNKLYLHMFDIADTAFSFERGIDRHLISAGYLRGRKK